MNEASETVASRVTDVAHSFSDEVTRRYGDVADVVKMASDKSVEFVKKYPVYSVLGAAAVGIVVGSMIRKKII